MVSQVVLKIDRYAPSKQIRFKTLMLRSDLCDFRDAYIVVKEDVILREAVNRNFIDVRNRSLAFKTTQHLLIAYQRSIVC